MRLQLRRLMRTVALVTGLCSAWPQRGAASVVTEEPALEYLLQYFTDSDHVGVRSSIGSASFRLRPDLGLAVHWNNERVVIPAIEAAAGSQEAVDAITTASRPIAGNAYQDFVKVRNEFQSGVSRGGVTLDYYLSSESDYLGQQLAASYKREVLDRQLNLSVGTSYGWDVITPLADDDSNTADDTRTTLHWNTVATRVVSPTTVVRAGLEYNLVSGLQHNPYRHVYAGGSIVPERHPDQRQRRDLYLRLHQYFPNRSSLKLGYRFYNDDWGIDSHEWSAALSQYVTQGMFARYQYRYYTQTPADFYRDEYATADGVGGYRSGDYRMDALASHLFGVALNFDLDALGVDSTTLRRLGAWISYERYFNSNNYSSNTLVTGLAWKF
jgi:uncharacterized protein DUF3570